MNKDFLKGILSEERELLELDQVKWINVGKYDELSVKAIWPQMQDDPEFLKHFPADMPKGRLPDRTYFFNILNTKLPAYVAALIKHANEQRNTAQNDGMADASIVLSDRWADKLMSIPFISCK